MVSTINKYKENEEKKKSHIAEMHTGTKGLWGKGVI